MIPKLIPKSVEIGALKQRPGKRVMRNVVRWMVDKRVGFQLEKRFGNIAKGFPIDVVRNIVRKVVQREKKQGYIAYILEPFQQRFQSEKFLIRAVPANTSVCYSVFF